MANPFLVLGGVAVGVITAGIGVLQVPGWIDSANDSAVSNDLSQVALSQEAAATVIGEYVSQEEIKSGVAANGEKTGVKFQPSSGVSIDVNLYADNEEWAAVGLSKSGHVFVRFADSTAVYTSTTDEKFKAGDTIDAATLGAFTAKDGSTAAAKLTAAGVDGASISSGGAITFG